MSLPYAVIIQIMIAYRTLSSNFSRETSLFFIIDATMTYIYKESSLNFTSSIKPI